MSETTLFHRRGDVYTPTPLTSSPWNPAVLHGGAPAALLSHLLETHGPADKQLARIVIDLLRPVPRQPLETRVHAIREGARLSILAAELWFQGKLVARASGTFVRPTAVTLPDYTPRPERLLPLPEYVETTNFDKLFGAKAVEIPRGLQNVVLVKPITPPLEQGSGRWWMAVPVSIIDDEPVTPLTRVGLLSDFCNGVGQLYLGNNTGMINADITIQLHRIPEGEWIGLDGTIRLDGNGVGTTRCQLFDVHGEIGSVMQTVMPQAEFNA